MAVLFWLIKLPAIDFKPPPWRRLFDTLPVSPCPMALLSRLPNKRSALNISPHFFEAIAWHAPRFTRTKGEDYREGNQELHLKSVHGFRCLTAAQRQRIIHAEVSNRVRFTHLNTCFTLPA